MKIISLRLTANVSARAPDGGQHSYCPSDTAGFDEVEATALLKRGLARPASPEAEAFARAVLAPVQPAAPAETEQQPQDGDKPSPSEKDAEKAPPPEKDADKPEAKPASTRAVLAPKGK